MKNLKLFVKICVFIILPIFIVPCLIGSKKAHKKSIQHLAKPLNSVHACSLSVLANGTNYYTVTDQASSDWTVNCQRSDQDIPCAANVFAQIKKRNWLTNKYDLLFTKCINSNFNCDTSQPYNVSVDGIGYGYGVGDYLVIFYFRSGSCNNPGTIFTYQTLFFEITLA